jgi:hypothetical protein
MLVVDGLHCCGTILVLQWPYIRSGNLGGALEWHRMVSPDYPWFKWDRNKLRTMGSIVLIDHRVLWGLEQGLRRTLAELYSE